MRIHALASFSGALLLACAGTLIGEAPSDKKSGAAQLEPPRQATFDARQEFQVKVPEGSKRLRGWFTIPQEVAEQKVADLRVESPYPHRFETDSAGNKFLYVEVENPMGPEFTITETFTLTRSEARVAADPAKCGTMSDKEREEMARYLEPNKNVPIDDDLKKLANEIVGTETNHVKAARKIYDWVLANIDYWVKDPKNKKASPVGSSTYCLASRTGNCTDFHSLWTSLARAEGIPTRIVYGSFFKAELDGQDIDQSYHCWLEFYAPGIGWIPHDVAVADIFVGDFTVNPDNDEKVRRTTADGYKGGDPAKVEYYFGNLDERRVTWSVGRDLTLTPKQEAGPVNAIAKAYIEVDGKALPDNKDAGYTRKLTFKQKK